MIGYTPLQAERLKERIDRQMAKIEDDVGTLGRLVTDHSGGWFGQVELAVLRLRASELKDIVDRRTRRPARREGASDGRY